MKGESNAVRRGILSVEEAEAVAAQAFSRLAADPERLSRFMALSGLDSVSIRAAAREQGFLPAILDHVASHEPLLLEIAAELGLHPARLVEARQKLSPEADWGA